MIAEKCGSGPPTGLAVWRDGKVISLANRGGPLRETILGILEDDAHQFWLTTNKGLVSVARSELDELADGGTRSPDFHIYALADGLRSSNLPAAIPPPAAARPTACSGSPAFAASS